MANLLEETRKCKQIARKKKALRIAAKTFCGFSKALLSIPYSIGKKIGMDDLACNLLMPFSEAVEHRSNCYVTYNLVPKYAKEQNDWMYYTGTNAEKFGIVIQGPILKRDDFTLETVRYYGKIYPGVLVIVSTWIDEDTAYIQRLEAEKNCIVVLCQYPEKSGIGNINYQTMSSLRGVQEAADKGKEYVLKTRSDTRVTMCGVMELLYQYTILYPLRTQTDKNQNQRIIMFSVSLFHPFHDSGMFFFGAVNDMLNYFDIELSEEVAMKDISYKMVGNKWSYRDLFNMPNGENYMNIKFFEKMNSRVECSLKEWWSVVADNIIALPISLLRPIWVKYDYNHEESNFFMTYRRAIMGGDGPDNTKVDFAMWLDMYHHEFKLDPSIYEDYLDVPMS